MDDVCGLDLELQGFVRKRMGNYFKDFAGNFSDSIFISFYSIFQMLKYNEHFCGYEDKPCIVFLFKKKKNILTFASLGHPCDYYSQFCSTLSVLIYLI